MKERNIKMLTRISNFALVTTITVVVGCFLAWHIRPAHPTAAHYPSVCADMCPDTSSQVYGAASLSTVRLGLSSGDIYKGVGTGVVVTDRAIITNDHVCAYLKKSKHTPFVEWINGARASVDHFTLSLDRAENDLCIVWPTEHGWIREHMMPAKLSDRDAAYGERLYNLSMYLSPWHMAEGPSGKPGPSRYAASTQVVVPLYANAAQGSSGSGVWSAQGEVVGIVAQVQHKPMVVGGTFLGSIARGVVFYIPVSQVREWLNNLEED